VAKRTRGSQEKGKSSSEAGPSGTRETQADKDEAAKNKAEWERAVKERAEKERAAKEKADKERAAKEKAEKEKANKERAAAKGKGKRKRYFENDWLNSPLNDPTVTNREDFTRAAEAYDAIPDMVEALQEAREALRAWLIDNK
jgi:membrane protein involved in colicin uptake